MISAVDFVQSSGGWIRRLVRGKGGGQRRIGLFTGGLTAPARR